MVTIPELWAAILVSAALAWIASALIWMLLPHHKTDYRALPDEEAARRGLGKPAPGLYKVPYCTSMEDFKNEAMQRKFVEGPIALITLIRSGMPSMGRMMFLSFVFNVVVSIMVAYVAGRALAPGAEYLHVFQIAGAVAWLAYGFAIIPEGIWFGRPWSVVIKTLLDALVYALVTAGAFGWLWPALG